MNAPYSGILSQLRRLYQHLLHDGHWNALTDTTLLRHAISTIEELSDGRCRFNCRTAPAIIKNLRTIIKTWEDTPDADDGVHVIESLENIVKEWDNEYAGQDKVDET